MELNRYLDQAVLDPALSEQEAKQAIELGVRYAVRTVCVRPMDIAMARRLCEGTETGVSTVLAFPHGCTLPQVKRAEALCYIEAGADEIDMVANYALIRSAEWQRLAADIQAVTQAPGREGVVVKVILETALLSVPQIEEATRVAAAAGADFVKTSTGFNGGGATEEAVQAMVRAAAGQLQVKASGGIRSSQAAQRFIELGASRLGVGYTSTPAICGG